ncbi:MAG TPA: hypothetical protein PLI09_06505 [Candidatus Hydrogenedentes bacterium]|nr:hypothetical protein [Candidatus Hydrogenedentota bacterium]
MNEKDRSHAERINNAILQTLSFLIKGEAMVMKIGDRIKSTMVIRNHCRSNKTSGRMGADKVISTGKNEAITARKSKRFPFVLNHSHKAVTAKRNSGGTMGGKTGSQRCKTRKGKRST